MTQRLSPFTRKGGYHHRIKTTAKCSTIIGQPSYFKRIWPAFAHYSKNVNQFFIDAFYDVTICSERKRERGKTRKETAFFILAFQ